MVELNSAKHQVVSGSLYHIRGVFKDKSSKLFDCHVTIWDQPWKRKRYQISIINKVPHVKKIRKPLRKPVRQLRRHISSSSSSAEE